MATQPREKTDRKNIWVIIICLVAIGASAVWIYHSQFAPPQINELLHRGIGEVMAEETKKRVGGKKRILVFAIDSEKAPELKVQLAAFENHLKGSGVNIEEILMVETKGRAKYRTGGGLSSGRLVRTLLKKKHLDGIVSFIGAPDLDEADYAELGQGPLPKFIAESMATEKLSGLFDKKILHAAIVPRYEFPSPFQGDPKTSRDWFTKRFQVMTNAPSVSPSRD